MRDSEYKVVANGDAAPPGGLVRGREEWDAAKPILLGHMTDDEFEDVDNAYARMEICFRMYPQNYEIQPLNSLPHKVEPGFTDALNKARESIAVARISIRRLASQE
jgi:hypothetical protein